MIRVLTLISIMLITGLYEMRGQWSSGLSGIDGIVLCYEWPGLEINCGWKKVLLGRIVIRLLGIGNL